MGLTDRFADDHRILAVLQHQHLGAARDVLELRAGVVPGGHDVGHVEPAIGAVEVGVSGEIERGVGAEAVPDDDELAAGRNAALEQCRPHHLGVGVVGDIGAARGRQGVLVEVAHAAVLGLQATTRRGQVDHARQHDEVAVLAELDELELVLPDPLRPNRCRRGLASRAGGRPPPNRRRRCRTERAARRSACRPARRSAPENGVPAGQLSPRPGHPGATCSSSVGDEAGIRPGRPASAASTCSTTRRSRPLTAHRSGRRRRQSPHRPRRLVLELQAVGIAAPLEVEAVDLVAPVGPPAGRARRRVGVDPESAHVTPRPTDTAVPATVERWWRASVARHRPSPSRGTRRRGVPCPPQRCSART